MVLPNIDTLKSSRGEGLRSLKAAYIPLHLEQVEAQVPVLVTEDESLMVEPFASIVCNTLLSGRSRLNSVVRTVVTTSPSPRIGISSNFYTPVPRRVKGKKKSEDVSPEAPLDCSLRDWSSSSSRHLFWWPLHTRLMMLDELSHDGKAASTKRMLKRPKPRPRTVKPLLTSPNNAFQRRHASYATKHKSKGPPPTISRSARSKKRINHFQRIIDLPPKQVDLVDAWTVYRDAKGHNIPTKMLFLEKYINASELRYWTKPSKNSPEDELHVLGERACSMLDDLAPIIVLGSRFDQWRLCLLARALALRGDFEGATNAARDADDTPIIRHYKERVVYAYDMILTSLVLHEGNVRAMKYIGDQWEDISPYLRSDTKLFELFESKTSHLQGLVKSLRETAIRVAIEIPEPLSFMAGAGWKKERRENVGCFFIEALCKKHLGAEGYEVFQEMERFQLKVTRRTQFVLVRSLARDKATIFDAVTVYKKISRETEGDQDYLRSGLYLFSRLGDTKACEDCFNSITSPALDDKASLINGYSVAGDVKRAEEAFQELFPLDENGKRTNSPTVAHYAAVINAHAKNQGSGQKRISFWLTDMANAGVVPNQYVFTVILNGFAAAGDLESTMTVLEQMRSAGVRPNVVTYTIVVTLLAHRQDPVGAEAIFKRALKEGVVPDNRMIVAVMNAHVEGGSWQGVIRAYDYLIAANITGVSLEVYNTLMKAYVLIGAPFNIVYNLFKRLEQTKAKPDAYTYSLLVQSACDAGLMHIAADIYYEMKDSLNWNFHANVYILTILMAGFLQNGDRVKAQGVYKEMLELGVQPSPITYRVILDAYGNEGSKESLKIAEQFIKSLVAVPKEERTWKKPKYDSLSALHHLYGPVLQGWGRMKSPEDVERVFQDLQNTGAVTSLGTLVSLLDVYRRTFNIDAVQEIWPQIQELGLKLTSKDWMTPEDGPSDMARGIRGNVLCVPLSIYIDALSAAGQHSQIAKVWKDLRSRGFSFNSHNWNHLSVAMVRAGEVERGFEVLERVIIPYQELSVNSRKARDRNPSSPLLSDVLKERREDEEEDEVPSVPAARSVARQAIAKINRSQTKDMEDFQTDDHSDDFAYHLHILHQISPSWAAWKAHRATLSVLLIAFNRLNEGRLIHPLGSTEHDNEDEELKAREMLHRIYDKYPKTVQLVLEHDEKERQMLTSDEYNERYNWD